MPAWPIEGQYDPKFAAVGDAFADLDARVSWAYIMNRMSPATTGDLLAAAPLAALYGSL